MEAFDNTMSGLKSKGLVLKNVKGLQDYFSFKIISSDDKKRAWLGQSHLIRNMEKKFGEHVARLQVCLCF